MAPGPIRNPPTRLQLPETPPHEPNKQRRRLNGAKYPIKPPRRLLLHESANILPRHIRQCHIGLQQFLHPANRENDGRRPYRKIARPLHSHLFFSVITLMSVTNSICNAKRTTTSRHNASEPLQGSTESTLCQYQQNPLKSIEITCHTPSKLCFRPAICHKSKPSSHSRLISALNSSAVLDHESRLRISKPSSLFRHFPITMVLYHELPTFKNAFGGI